MSYDHTAIRESVSELQSYVTHFFNIGARNFSIKIVPEVNVAYTDLSEENESVIYISEDNICIKHVLGHEIAHTQVPVKNTFFAEGFASLISCKLAGDCSPFWFSEKTVTEVVQNYCHKYISVKELLICKEAFCDFAKFSARYAHVIAAGFVEWILNACPGFAENVISNIKVEPEIILLDKYKYSLSSLEEKWLESMGVTLSC